MIHWTYAFIDRPSGMADTAASFWTAATATTLSPKRGASDEFATLVPSDGSPYLKFQSVVDGLGGVHIDLSTDEVDALSDLALHLGAGVEQTNAGWNVLRSPGGLATCVVPWHGERRRPAVVSIANASTSRVDQVCIDVPASRWDAEIAFWTDLTGWTSRAGSRPEFHIVRPDPAMPIRILIQRLDSPSPTSAHLDIACSDVNAVREWHETLGAQWVSDGPATKNGPQWTVMHDPAGGVYCLTSRDPVTGSLPG